MHGIMPCSRQPAHGILIATGCMHWDAMCLNSIFRCHSRCCHVVTNSQISASSITVYALPAIGQISADNKRYLLLSKLHGSNLHSTCRPAVMHRVCSSLHTLLRYIIGDSCIDRHTSRGSVSPFVSTSTGAFMLQAHSIISRHAMCFKCQISSQCI